MKITNITVFSVILFTNLAVSVFQQANAQSVGSSLPNAQPGQCFAEVKVPARYRAMTRKVLTRKALSKRVLVRPVQYKWLTKKIQVRKGKYQNHFKPAQYKTVQRKVMVKPATEKWKKGYGAITRLDNMTGQIMCRVKVPAVYKTVTKQVLVHPSKTTRTFTPPVYRTVKQKVVIAPAQYKTVQEPAQYKIQSYHQKVKGEHKVWRPILCSTNSAGARVIKKPKAKRKAPKLSKDFVLKIQTSLKHKGFDPGEIDGQYGKATATALGKFQESRGLPIGRITKDTSRALGLIR